MTTIKQWSDNIEKKNTKQLQDLNNAINTLRGWDLFFQEYKGQGVFFLHEMILQELRQRE